MARGHNQHPIHIRFGPSDKPFRDPIGLRHPNWRANDSDPLSLEHRVEAARELAIVFANQERRHSGIVIAVTSNMAHANTSSPLRVGDAFAEQTR